MQKILALAALLFASTLVNASAVSGSLSFVFVDVVGTGGYDLSTFTVLTATDSLIEGPGSGDLAVVPLLTSFGPISIHQSTILTGGSFAINNAMWGSFAATSGTLITRTPTFLNIDLSGTFDPGPGLVGFTSAPAVAHVTFDQTGTALSGAFTLDATPVPEPESLALLGSSLLMSVGIIRMRSREEEPAEEPEEKKNEQEEPEEDSEEKTA